MDFKIVMLNFYCDIDVEKNLSHRLRPVLVWHLSKLRLAIKMPPKCPSHAKN
ncbi:MAG: hypothetical protein LBI61_04065 [Puniceicoccales bacterium]|nr:hypothetical protein [Puniceicoccales bacterium]